MAEKQLYPCLPHNLLTSLDTLTEQPGMESEAKGVVTYGSHHLTREAVAKKSLPIEDVPSRLKCLVTAKKLVLQKVSRSANKYDIWNATTGERVYYAFEEASPCEKCCCGRHRGFTVRVNDNFGKEALRLTRPSHCCCGELSDVFADSDTCIVQAESGNVIGTVVLHHGCFVRYKVKNADDRLIVKIDDVEGDCDCNVLRYPVVTASGKRIGVIEMTYGGCFSRGDFVVKFPIDLDPNAKALILAAVLFKNIFEFDE